MKRIKGIVAIVLSVMTMGVFCSCGSPGVRSYSQVEIPLPGQTASNSNSFKNASVGDIIKFGAYEQDNLGTNGKEKIEWLVLDKEGDKALVISKYALDLLPYNTSETSVTWETCSLRKWLNETFINDAFNSDEQKRIQETTVTADKNPEYDTSPGNDTIDKVFLLSVPEVTRYFSSNKERQCMITEYAESKGGFIDGFNGIFTWWLRSPSYDSTKAAQVYNNGSLTGTLVAPHTYGVRPAMWIKLDS